MLYFTTEKAKPVAWDKIKNNIMKNVNTFEYFLSDINGWLLV